MKTLFCSFLLIVICIGGTVAQTPTPATQANPTPSTSPSPISLQDYRGILENERKLLEDQSERYYTRVDSLITRTLSVLGIISAVALGLFVWQFGKTRKELKDTVREQFQSQVSSLIETEMNALRTSVRELQTQVEQLQASQNQLVVWVFSGEEMNAQPEHDALRAMGMQNINIVIPATDEAFGIGDPDLVIFSYDGTEEGRRRLNIIVTALKEMSPPVSLLIYTYNPEGDEIVLQAPEREILQDFLWYLPVNYPTTLVSQTQLLIRANRHI